MQAWPRPRRHYRGPLVRSAVLVCVVMALTACASVAPIGTTEYRAGLVLHRHPDFSFRIPDSWRPANSADWFRFGANQRVLQRMNEQGRAVFQQSGEQELRRYSAVLISSSGEWIDVQIAPNQGTQFTSGYVLSDGEKRALWARLESDLVRAAAPDKPKFVLGNVTVRDYGPNTVLRIEMDRDDQRGVMAWTILGFFRTSHVVTVSHAGLPGAARGDVTALEEIARSFRFE